MTVTHKNNAASDAEPEVGQPAQKVPRAPRQTDGGPDILPGMQHSVALTRKVKRPALLLRLVEQVSKEAWPEMAALVTDAHAVLPTVVRKVLFQRVAAMAVDYQQHLERAAEQVLLLDDDYGAQAVQSLLVEDEGVDADVLETPSDRTSRALHLYLLQELPLQGTRAERRFEHAEHLQVMHRQWKSENYSSHYLGPKGIAPQFDSAVQDTLRTRIAALYPHVQADQILIELFTRMESTPVDSEDSEEGTGTVLAPMHTLTATFNGTTANFKQVEDGEVVAHEEPAATSASFSWDPESGALGVFCEDKESRRDLATVFRDTVLACDGVINDMPMREFDLLGFSSPKMLERLKNSRVDGVDSINILQFKITRPFEQVMPQTFPRRDMVRRLESTLTVCRDRRDHRNIYQVAYEDYGLDDLTGYVMSHVKLVMGMSKQPYRKAHNVVVQITTPNGLNDKSKSVEDGKRVITQLVELGVLREF
jgi:hypothetical protein